MYGYVMFYAFTLDKKYQSNAICNFFNFLIFYPFLK